MISGLQVRAARAFLVWDRRDLSRKAVVPLGMIESIETGVKISGKAMVAALAAVQSALEAEGIEFTDNDGVFGVRLHPKPARRLVELRLKAAPRRDRRSHEARAKASAMAGEVVDQFTDATAPVEEQEKRKRRLIKGPREFRGVRKDQPGGAKAKR